MSTDHASLTDDGSSTYYSAQFDAHYHSTHGALQESQHVFIEHGLRFYHSAHNTEHGLKILEFGFGTGLNALLTAQVADELNQPVIYHTLEAYPITTDIATDLNYGALLNAQALYTDLHSCSWGKPHPITPRFSILKHETLFEEHDYDSGYQIIYYDAFAPTAQSHLWDEMMMKKCYDALDTEGILVTFCAKGSFKRSLKAVGFEVERLPGPPGKREMTRATKR